MPSKTNSIVSIWLQPGPYPHLHFWSILFWIHKITYKSSSGLHSLYKPKQQCFRERLRNHNGQQHFCWRHLKINRTSHFFLLYCCDKYTYITNRLNNLCLFVTFSMLLYNAQVRKCRDILNCIVIKLSASEYFYGHVLTINKTKPSPNFVNVLQSFMRGT